MAGRNTAGDLDPAFWHADSREFEGEAARLAWARPVWGPLIVEESADEAASGLIGGRLGRVRSGGMQRERSIREGGTQTMTNEQLAAVCGEANAQGMRTMVHAHSPESITASVNAGCQQIEHGVFATDEVLKLMADKGVYFDPNVGVVLQNYLKNRDKYNGIGNYNDEGFAYMEKGLSLNVTMIKKAVATPNLKMVLGTDAVAGAHGHNADEIVERVRQGGQKPMDAIISATSMAAKSMRLDTTIGTLAAGYEADIVGLDGDPLADITAVTRVAFVMKGGKVYKFSAGTARGARPTP